jgi:hypothetical protein
MLCGQTRSRAIYSGSIRSVASRRRLLESRFAAGQGYSNIPASSRYQATCHGLCRSCPCTQMVYDAS